MKKPIAILILLSLALTGCAGGNAQAPGASGTAAETAEAQSTAAPQNTGTEQSGSQAAAPGTDIVTTPSGETTQPGSRADAPQGKRVRGQIKDILGNEVTLALMEEPKRPEGTTEAAPKPKTTGDPMGGPPGMGGGGSSVKLTGETVGIQIPVGVPISSRGQGGDTALQLSDLSTGDILTVLYDTDGTTIIRVNVSAGGAQ